MMLYSISQPQSSNVRLNPQLTLNKQQIAELQRFTCQLQRYYPTKTSQRFMNKNLTQALKTYLKERYSIQMVSPDELSKLFDAYFERVERLNTSTLAIDKKGLFYAYNGQEYFTFKSLSEDCEAQSFATELQALCWLVTRI